MVGALARLRWHQALGRELELSHASPEDAGAGLERLRPDVVLVDGALPGARVKPLLDLLGPPGASGRPSLLVVLPPGRRAKAEPAYSEHADDVVSAALGDAALLGRVRVALRVRGIFAELARKNAELEALYGRLEGLAHRMAEELRLASNVQRSLLPPPLNHPRLDISREFIPVREIGGDYFDLIPLGPQRLAFALGDVMGKGVPAALLAANLKACLRAQLLGGEITPEELITRVNRLFWDVTPKGLFASLFFGIYDLERGAVEYVNAGHHYPFVVRPDGTIHDLVNGGTVLGLMEESRYERGEAFVDRDDLLVLYSDGVTDRGNPEGDLYGIERLKEAALRSRRDNARIALYTLLGDVQGWSDGSPAEDDMTLIVVKVR